MEREVQAERIAELMRIEEITGSMLSEMGYSDIEKERILQDYHEKYVRFEKSLSF